MIHVEDLPPPDPLLSPLLPIFIELGKLGSRDDGRASSQRFQVSECRGNLNLYLNKKASSMELMRPHPFFHPCNLFVEFGVCRGRLDLRQF